MSRLVVLGAGGFIGRHLVRELAKVQVNTVVAFGRFSDYQLSAESPFDDLDNVEIFPGNFLNREDVTQAVSGADYVFHFVSSTNPAVSSHNPFIDIDTNVRSSVELFEICRDKGVKKIIFPSSGGTVYGDTDLPHIDEQTVPRPYSPYGIAKLTIENYLRYFKKLSSMDYVVYRIANPYGPGQNVYGKQGVIPIFMHKVLSNQPITVYGDGSMIRDYIYIDDLIQMITKSYDKPHAYPEYNLATGTGESVNDIIAALQSCTGTAVTVEHVKEPSTFVRKSVLNIERFEAEFGNVSFISLTEGIQRTWEYVKRQD